jgi:hypothetical protein
MVIGPVNVELQEVTIVLEICKMTETGSVRRNGLSLFSRMKTGIFWDLLAFLTILLNK